MNINDSNIIQELGELLDIAEDANVTLAAENNELKDILIGTLLELNEFKDAKIAELEDVIFGDEGICEGCGGLH